MRKKDVEKISDVVSAILRMQGLETPLNEARAVNAWSEVVGERVANATGNVRIYNQVLFVEVPSPALRNNLFMQKLEAGKTVKVEGKANNLLELIAADPAFNLTLEELQKSMDPAKYTGRAKEQTERFVSQVVQPILDYHKEMLGIKAEIHV